MEKLKKIINNIFTYFIFVSPVLFIFDLISKYYFQWLLQEEGNSIKIIDGFFSLTLVYNRGAFSGFLGGVEVGGIKLGTIILFILSIVGVAGGIYVYIKKYNSLSSIMKFGLALLIPGAAGNLVDRFLTIIGKQPGVIDFLHFYNLPIPFYSDFPVFNFADSYLTISIFIIVIAYIIDEYKKGKANG